MQSLPLRLCVVTFNPRLCSSHTGPFYHRIDRNTKTGIQCYKCIQVSNHLIWQFLLFLSVQMIEMVGLLYCSDYWVLVVISILY